MKLIDIAGKKFGRLTVLSKLPPLPSKTGGSLWACRCECGNLCNRASSNLRKENSTPSCGCFQNEWASHLGANPAFISMRANSTAIHGQKRQGAATPEYKTWLRMKSRCYRKSDKDFPYYGGRGIGVCDRWATDFAAFYKDMGSIPSPGYTIDRLRSNENYGPDNCRWATMQQQGAENRRGLIAITVQSLSFNTIAAACRHFGVRATTVNERIKAGISIDEAFTPSRLKSRRSRESYLPKDQR